MDSDSLGYMSLLSKLSQTIIATAIESWHAYWLIINVTLPIIFAIRVIEEFVPIIEIFGAGLSPLMGILNLPEQAAIAWTAAIFLQPLAGFAIIAEHWNDMQLNVAQATIFALLVLEVHAIFVEAKLAQLVGVRIWFTVTLRFGFAIMLGVVLNLLFTSFDILQEPAQMIFDTDLSTDNSWQAWFMFQLKTWSVFAVILFSLNLLMRTICAIKLDKLIAWILQPFLYLMGIHKSAATVGVIGLVLGLTFGATLIMAEVKKGTIPRRDIFLTVSLLGICHSILEDTLLAMLFGAHIVGALFARLIFSIVFMGIFSRLLKLIPEKKAHRWLMTTPAKAVLSN